MSFVENSNRMTVDLILLSMLRGKDLGATQLAVELAKNSNQTLAPKVGCLYFPLLHLEQKGYILHYYDAIEQKKSYYRITPEGIEYLQSLIYEYMQINSGVMSIIEYSREKSY